MAKFGEKPKLLEYLMETPLVSFACKKVGIDRRTYYRWYHSDKDFRDKVDQILSIGRKGLNDTMEAVLIREGKKGSLRAVTFWLQHNHPRYRPVRTDYVEPFHDHHQLKPGEVCGSCGHREPSIEDYERSRKNVKGKMDSAQLAEQLHRRLLFGEDKKSKNEIKRIIDDFVKENNMKNGIEFVDFSEKPSEDEPSTV